jgi:hypothetical protein
MRCEAEIRCIRSEIRRSVRVCGSGATQFLSPGFEMIGDISKRRRIPLGAARRYAVRLEATIKAFLHAKYFREAAPPERLRPASDHPGCEAKTLLP